MRKILLVVSFSLISTVCFAKIQETTWSPDTCDGCVVTYEWDDSVPQEHRVHSFKRIIKENPAFVGLKDSDQYDKILEENQRKNISVGVIVDTDTARKTTKKQSAIIKLKTLGLDDEELASIGADPDKPPSNLIAATDIGFSYDSTRKLHLTNVPINGKAGLTTALENKLGADKIAVD